MDDRCLTYLAVAEEQERAKSAIPEVKMEDGEDGGDGEVLTIDDTSEFVRSIAYHPVAVKPEPVEPAIAVKRSDTPPDVPMEDGDEAVTELEAGELPIKEEEDDEDEAAVLNAIETAIKHAEAEQKKAAEDGELGTAGEQTFGSGMASTLKILRQQGLIADPTADQSDREHVQRQRDLWLANQRRRVAERELDRVRSRGQPKDQATREYENRLREQAEARETLEAYRDYKPDVQIVYHDEFGRNLTPKEAWKALSHKFHGKGSGRMKTEKKLKRIAEEKKQEAMASGDTPLSMQQAFQIRQEKAGQAHFVLSVGNRGFAFVHRLTFCSLLTLTICSAVPQAAEFFDAQPLTKGKTEKGKNKKKEARLSTPQALGGDAFMTLPLPVSNGGSNDQSAASSPAPRAGFSRINAAASDSMSNAVGGERTKVTFGFKRKAGEEPSGTPPPKRR